MTESKPAGRLERLQAFRGQHVKAEIATFFAAGMLFDIVTLGRVDDTFTLVQQGVYLALLVWLMILEERERAKVWAPPRLLAKAWRFSEDAIHFLLGSLLSSFTLLYLKSSSGLSAFLFMSLLGGLLVANELPRFRERGPVVRWALLSLCLTSYLALLLPVLIGFLSKWLFVLAVVLSCAAFAWLVRRLSKRKSAAADGQGMESDSSSLSRVASAGFGIQAVLVGAYFLGAIPPVPLSLQYIGIYHEVLPPSAQPAGAITYELRHQRPWWKPWQHGDQDFKARPGDVIYCFARVFAPTGFRDAIYVRWLVKGQGGWQDQGRARLDINGGRDKGFRVIATKKSYQPGRWRVEVETDDGRDLGVIHFDLISDASSDVREYKTDRL
ncbi:MAG TPA: DUF2914 domain-containing protein [Candidatus Polarisedimenticolia bacterium]|nr:DUF2914 domain-containing protein [Candidatus Polarisedimenticolia bacterium]